MTENNPIEKENFNMALSILERINNLINCCAAASIEKNFAQWFNYLLTLKRQISFKFSDVEVEKSSLFCSLLYDLLPEFEQKMNYSNKLGKYILRFGEEDYQTYGLFEKALEEYQSFLLSCFDKRDMLSSKKEDKRKTIGEM